MAISTVFNKLGQTILPKITTAVFPDLLTVQAETTSRSNYGGMLKTATSNAYTSVPCAYQPLNTERRIEQGGKTLSSQEYLVIFATHKSGSRINIDPVAYKLIVAARGNEPAKTFRIISVRDKMGVVFECVCQREN